MNLSFTGLNLIQNMKNRFNSNQKNERSVSTVSTTKSHQCLDPNKGQKVLLGNLWVVNKTPESC